MPEPAPEGEGGEQPPRAAADWAGILRDAPHRINEVPAKERGAALQALREAERAALQQEAQAYYERGVAQERERQRVAAAVAEIDQLRAEDPEAFVRWEDEYPDRALAYRQHKVDAGRPAGGAGPGAVIMSAARSVVAKLSESPAAKEAIEARQRQDPSRYALTEQGLANLTADVAEALAEVRAAGPERRKAQERQEAAAAAKGLPKPPESSGTAGGGGALTPERLQAMSQADVLAWMAKPGGEEEIDRVMRQIATR